MSGAARPVRVFLADDHEIVRTGVRQLLASDEDFVVVGEAADGAKVLEAPLDECDVLVLDISLPRYGGIEVLRRVRVKYPALRVVVMSMYPADQYAARVVTEGAFAYVSKDQPAEDLLHTVRRAVRGGPPQPVAPRVTPAPMPHDQLTAREYQVLILLSEGKKVVDVAAEIDVAPSTVSNHVAHIKEKLGVDSIGAIVGYAHRVGLVD